MPKSRKRWGLFVFMLGALWAAGGMAGLLLPARGEPAAPVQQWAYLLLGILLMRVGWNIRNPSGPGKDGFP